MKEAKIVKEWLGTNPTGYQKEVVKKWVHQTMFIFFMVGFIFCILVFLLLGAIL